MYGMLEEEAQDLLERQRALPQWNIQIRGGRERDSQTTLPLRAATGDIEGTAEQDVAFHTAADRINACKKGNTIQR